MADGLLLQMHEVPTPSTSFNKGYESSFLKLCAEACGDVCQTYKKLHQSIPVGFSLMALHSVFLAGTLIILPINTFI